MDLNHFDNVQIATCWTLLQYAIWQSVSQSL